MGNAIKMPRPSSRHIAAVAGLILALDQLTKYFVLRMLGRGEERIVVEGFFKFVHWGNTGAAWSLFMGRNEMLAIIALVALLALFLARHHFDTRTRLGQIALGMIAGGIAGNLVDRLLPSRHEVIDFLRFYLNTTNGEVGFPAFNVADSGICIGVALIFWITWKTEREQKPTDAPTV